MAVVVIIHDINQSVCMKKKEVQTKAHGMKKKARKSQTMGINIVLRHRRRRDLLFHYMDGLVPKG